MDSIPGGSTSSARGVGRGLRRPQRLGGVAFAFVALAALLAVPSARAQVALPVSNPAVSLTASVTERVHVIDLDTLPARPEILIDVVPDAAHGDMQLEVELMNFVPDPGVSPYSIGCPLSPIGSGSWLSDPGVGAVHLEAELYFCYPGLTFWDGIDAEVRVRVLDFGSGGSPATVSVDIRGVTEVPTELLVQQVMGTQTVSLEPYQDTVLYASDTSASNGGGQFLWSGTQVENIFVGYLRYPLHSLMSFDFGSVVPVNAVVSGANLDLFSTGTLGLGGTVSLSAVAPGSFWYAGFADAPGSEFSGIAGSSSSVTWLERSFSESWVTGGGDTMGPPLVSQFIASAGPRNFSSPELVSAVQDMVDSGSFHDGFLLSGPSAPFSTAAVQFASGEHPDPNLRPIMTVEFSQAEPYGEGSIHPDLVDFIDEGEDFRWVYDLDEDGIFVTDIGGICETDSIPGFTYPYTYSYGGSPGYVGLDCCTWRIESTHSGTVGTGQALFFHNVDASDPANMPADFDGDGIRDPCDNCIYTPNGPALGSCMAGAVLGGPCHSDLECGPGEVCELSQTDTDGNFVGDACPEPSFGTGLMLGVAALSAYGGRRPGRVQRPGAES